VLGLVGIGAGLCWVIAETGRPGRLALLINAVRGCPAAARGLNCQTPGAPRPNGRSGGGLLGILAIG